MLLKRNFKSHLVLLSYLFLSSACSSHAQSTVTKAQAENVVIKKEELAQLKHAAKQWHNVSTKEEELQQLEKKLTQLTATLKKIEQHNQPTESIFNLTARLSKTPTLFAIQVAAFEEQHILYTLLAQLERQAPDIINASTIVNIEPTTTNNATYYRLKLGAYKSKAEAQSDCIALMQQQIDCFVSNYTAALN